MIDLDYHELLQKYAEVEVDISRENIELVEKDTRTRAKSSGFFQYHAERIGISASGAAFHSNLSQPSQALMKTICYPNGFKGNTKATGHGCKHEDDAIRDMKMEKLIVTLHLPDVVSSSMSNIPFYMIVTPDFLTSCDCCGLGWGGVKCHSCYILEKNACLEKVDGVFLPEKAPQLLFSSAAGAIHLN